MTAPWRPGRPPGAPRPGPGEAGGAEVQAGGAEAEAAEAAKGEAAEAIPQEGEAVRTGHPAVDGALQAMSNAADLPAAEQIAEYEAAHRTLQETLATIDEA